MVVLIRHGSRRVVADDLHAVCMRPDRDFADAAVNVQPLRPVRVEAVVGAIQAVATTKTRPTSIARDVVVENTGADMRDIALRAKVRTVPTPAP